MNSALVSRLLVKEAIPTLFPNLPFYYSKPKHKPRSDNSCQTRHEKTFLRLEKEAEAFLEGENFFSVDDMMERLDLSCFPDVLVTKKDNVVLICQLALSEDDSPPQLIFAN
eukprot:TRINITY_DN500_c0_g2_i4.p1 TRINITY_DN500_c0_g2~~TRINITY_DN500_c0_g2_i4.p1  ORF type:complete len:111 (-),score=18.66 TRINITY_DN500_c0_g2_i4:586-918(-)